MASSYSTDLKIELMVTGENAGTWGDKTNDNLNVIQQAIAGYGEQSIAGGAQTTVLTIANSPTLSVARNIVLKLTGTITGNQIVTVPSGIEKTWIVSNGTTGAFQVQFKTTDFGSSGTIWSSTDKGIKILYSNGTEIYPADLSTLSGTVASASIANLAITSGKLASFAVTEARLASFAVTASRLATNAVTAIKIAQSTITQSKLATGSVGADQLIATAVTPATYTNATVTVDADGRITGASSGAGGAAGYIPRIVASGASGNVTGTWTAQPGTTKIFGYAASGGGGGSKRNSPPGGGPGAVGAYGVFKITTGNYQSIPFQAGTYGSGAGSQGQNGGAGGTTQLGNFFTITGGAGGQFNANTAPAQVGQITVGSPSFIFNNTPSSLQPTLLYGAANRGDGAGGDGNNPQFPGNPGGQGVLILYESEN
jgi:hypothetical protein